MGERKVLNKYYPPDFDPSKLPRVRRPKNQQIKVRMMLPMSIRCNTCGNYIYKGTKFNSRKEDVIGETYLGIQIFRFYFKCTRCSAELTMKTDPQNSDYIVESGATRNFEPWREEDEASEKEKHKRNAEEMGDAMKSLENRTLDSKREMDILAALDEMKSMKSRHATVSIDSMLVALQQTAVEKEKKLEEEDEALIKSIVFNSSKDYVKRIPDDEFDDSYHLVQHSSDNGGTSGISAKKQKVSEEFSYVDPTNTSTKAGILNSLTSKGNDSSDGTSGDAKIVSKSSLVTVSIIKKPERSTAPVENKQRKEDTNNGLESLFQIWLCFLCKQTCVRDQWGRFGHWYCYK